MFRKTRKVTRLSLTPDSFAAGTVAAERVDVAADDRVAHDEAEADDQDGRGGAGRSGRPGSWRAGHGEGEDRGDHARRSLSEEQVRGRTSSSYSCCRRAVADLLETRAKASSAKPMQQREVVVVGVRADLGQEAVRRSSGSPRGTGRAVGPSSRIWVRPRKSSMPGEGHDEGRDADIRDPEALPGTRDRAR